jgi:hypothetical protein
VRHETVLRRRCPSPSARVFDVSLAPLAAQSTARGVARLLTFVSSTVPMYAVPTSLTKDRYRAVDMPRAFRPAAMARSDIAPAVCSSVITGLTQVARSAAMRALGS